MFVYKKSNKGLFGGLSKGLFEPTMQLGNMMLESLSTICFGDKLEDTKKQVYKNEDNCDNEFLEVLTKCEIVRENYRSLDELKKFHFISQVLPVLRCELTSDDIELAKVIEVALVISTVDVLKLECFLKLYKQRSKSKFCKNNIFDDFVVYCFKCFNADWNEYFDYVNEGNAYQLLLVPKNVSICKNDHIYKYDLIQLARKHKIEPFIIDLSKVYKINNDTASYKQLYSVILKVLSKKKSTLDTIVDNIDKKELVCIGISYLKFNGDKSISDVAIHDMLPPEFLMKYDNLWWKCQLWGEYRQALDYTPKYYTNYDWLNEETLGHGLEFYLNKHRNKLALQGKPIFELTFTSHLKIEPKIEKVAEVKDLIVFESELETSELTNKDNTSISLSIQDNENLPNDVRIDDSKKKRGKPTHPLEFYFCPNKQLGDNDVKQLIEDLKSITKGLYGVKFAQMIAAAVRNNIFMEKPPRNAFLKYEFHDFGGSSGYSDAFNTIMKRYDVDLKEVQFCIFCDEQMKKIALKYGFEIIRG